MVGSGTAVKRVVTAISSQGIRHAVTRKDVCRFRFPVPLIEPGTGKD